MTWDFLSSTTLTEAGDTIDSGTIQAKKTLFVQVFGIATGNLDACVIRFNGSTSGYSIRKDNDGDGGSTNTNENGINYMSANASQNHYADFQIMNIDGEPKILIDRTVRDGGSGAGSPPSRKVMLGKWTGTDQITQIQVVNRDGSGSYNTNSYLNVFGSD
jgi:hypothetical protein|tara:strand:- start:165 stop:644 length:480 start_codon:yes stop_codon:yes gene_type:complete